ncbi:MAG TPA: TM2 domain-containing protein [Terriglobales bacterium]|nr:TM2 domain-containing protein [Terriglobales bacterium]
MDAPAPRSKGPGEKFCSECGELIRARAELCPQCGCRQMPLLDLGGLSFPLAPNGKSQLAAALFGIFMGGIGVHKFYLGQTGWGIVYLLFCWTLIPAVVGMIEGILLLTMSHAQFVARYGKTDSKLPN